MDAMVDKPLAHKGAFVLRDFCADSAGIAAVPFVMWLFYRSTTAFSLRMAVAAASLNLVWFWWFYAVSSVVPEPYLDEVFHIPQAQKYCAGRFREWDDKITTPPGLYLFSLVVPEFLKGPSRLLKSTCGATSLRASSGVAWAILAYLALQCRHRIEARLSRGHGKGTERPYSQYALHTAFNVALFPLLFFFSGLYYTDVASTAAVLLAYRHHLDRVGRERCSILSDLGVVVLGIATLFFRQTNVFWVVVYIGGAEAVGVIKTLRPERPDQPAMDTLSEQVKYYLWRYSLGDVHDPPLDCLWPDDVLFCAISFGVAALCNPLRVVARIWPYVAVLSAFGCFVAWNGGVVLGDKSNHVATVHFAQMLYIWAFFGFFSLPLLASYAVPAVDLATRVFRCVTGRASTSRTTSPSDNDEKRTNSPKGSQPVDSRSAPLRCAAAIFNGTCLQPVYVATTVVLSLAVVRYNTIIHPFTLADNRHYMFYVFRYTIRRSPLIRYVLVLPYTVSRWMVWGTLGGRDARSAYDTRQQVSRCWSKPFGRVDGDAGSELERPVAEDAGKPGSKSSSSSSSSSEQQPSVQETKDDPLSLSADPAPTSTGLIFLLATTLSLITAPLVEPRYFIIPWVMWRLLVPAWRLYDHQGGDDLVGEALRSSWGSRLLRPLKRQDLRLVLETVWFAAINVATGYVFLAKPYVWRAEDGTLLDEGRLQRFMW